jgi:hypothetical protein
MQSSVSFPSLAKRIHDAPEALSDLNDNPLISSTLHILAVDKKSSDVNGLEIGVG